MPDLARTLVTLAKGGAPRALPRRPRRASRGSRAGGRRHVDTARPRGVPRHLAPARSAPTFEGRAVRLEPAPFLGRSAHRLRTGPPRPARRKRAGRERGVDPVPRRGHARGGPRAGRAASPATSTAAGLARRLCSDDAIRAALERIESGAARRARAGGRARNDAHLRGRRAGERRFAHRVDRRRLRRHRARHRDPPEQHARRVRPEPVRSSTRALGSD